MKAVFLCWQLSTRSSKSYFIDLEVDTVLDHLYFMDNSSGISYFLTDN